MAAASDSAAEDRSRHEPDVRGRAYARGHPEGATALNAALGKRAKSLADWVVLHLVGLCTTTLVVALLVLNEGAVDPHSIVLDPGAAASYVLTVFGVADQSWLDAFLVWLRRPAFVGVAMAASAFAGVALLRWRRHGTEVAWIMLILASTAIGPRVVRCRPVRAHRRSPRRGK